MNWESKPQPARRSRTKLEINYRLEKLCKPTKQKTQNAENVKEKTETAFSWSLYICCKDN